jgi:hypothetical protein
MAIIIQKTVKNIIYIPSGSNYWKNLRSFDCFLFKTNPISKNAQMNVSPYNTRDYKNKFKWTFSENKPKQTQFKPKQILS